MGSRARRKQVDYLTLRIEIQQLLNRRGMEKGSDTPDFILADFLVDCLEAFDDATRAREKWYGLKRVPAATLND